MCPLFVGEKGRDFIVIFQCSGAHTVDTFHLDSQSRVLVDALLFSTVDTVECSHSLSFHNHIGTTSTHPQSVSSYFIFPELSGASCYEWAVSVL